REGLFRRSSDRLKPLVESAAFAVGQSPVRAFMFIAGRTAAPEVSDSLFSSAVSLAAGIRNDENSITEVIGANGCRRNAIPLRIIPARGQVSEYDAQPSSKQRCYVLHDDVAGSKLANDPGKLRPQAGAFASNACSLSGIANVLAGEASADEINGREIVSADFSHVSESD